MRRTLNVLVVLFVSATVVKAEDWTRFRGNDGQGIATSVVPIEWTKTDNVAWSTELPGSGSSSPIFIGDRVFMTCYEGQSGQDANRTLVCVDAKSGDVVWEKSIAAPQREDQYGGYLTEHGYASGSPVSDGEAVYALRRGD